MSVVEFYKQRKNYTELIDMQVDSKHSEILIKDFVSSTEVKHNTKFDDSIHRIAKKEGYITYKICKKDIVADGGNYLGVLAEIDIKGKTAGGYQETAIFCKSMTPEPIDMGFLSLENVYKVELFAYKELSKVISDLQDYANIPTDERFNVVKCFDESNETVLFLDNLARKGFKTWYRMDIVTLEMAEVCIKQLARFHGISFVLKRDRQDYYNDYIKNIGTPLKACSKWDLFVDKAHKMALDVLDDGLKTKYGDKLRSILSKVPEYHRDDSTAYCLCHGDYRPNNILIKEKNGIVVEAVPVDYQLMFYSCPLLDFIYFIYMATDYQFRRAHMTHLKDLYYDSLDTYLQYYDMSAENELPRRTFERMYKEKLDFGLMVSCVYTPFLFVVEDEDVPDMTKTDIADIDLKLDDRYRQRMVGTVQEFIDLGYL